MTQRQAQRFLLSVIVNYEMSVHESSLRPVETPVAGKLMNISNGGLCLLTDVSLKVGQVLKMALPLHSVEATAPTLAEVRWVRKEDSQGSYQAGLRFLL
ncbi:MAG TPA: PilZ domain-containing protein [Nitrospiria bacterium]|jgi:c-di-GMP-binding flagellar brake protein YcgR|nr:PilZ domain-containing protein [Nitrospiria bacterium]